VSIKEPDVHRPLAAPSLIVLNLELDLLPLTETIEDSRRQCAVMKENLLA